MGTDRFHLKSDRPFYIERLQNVFVLIDLGDNYVDIDCFLTIQITYISPEKCEFWSCTVELEACIMLCEV